MKTPRFNRAAINAVVDMEAVELLVSTMREGIAEFEFIKRDGSVRHAFGTRLPNLIKEHVVGGEGPAGVVSFWDVEKAEWRSVRPHTITKIW